MWAAKHNLLILVLLLILSFAIRLVAVFSTVDIPGDGPTRAIVAYDWSRSPHIETGGVWLPGFMYLAGIFSFIVDNPLISARILNLIIGTLTIPPFYLLVHRIYGSAAALLSASILAFLPLHIGLSASSLAETSFLLEVVAGTTFLIIASEKTKSEAVYLSLALLSLCLAVMTRYEAWVLIPLFPSYYFWKTRKIVTAALITIALLAFPLTWVTTNYCDTGKLVYGFTAPELSPSTEPVDLIRAVNIVAKKSISHLGWALFIAIICGGLIQIVQTSKRKIDTERVLYVLITLFFWTFMLYFTMVRGKSLQHRYLLFGFVMALPFALIPFTYYFSNYRQWLVIIICIALGSVGLSNFFRRPQIYVTRTQPTEIKRLAVWLEKSPYRNESILLTTMGWQSSYLPLYFPSISRSFTVSSWTNDSTLQEFLKNQQASLLVTSDGDEEFQSRIEHFLGDKSYRDRLILREGTISVYLLKP